MRAVWTLRCLWVVSLCSAGLAGAAEGQPRLTLLEGPAVLHLADRAVTAREGLRLAPGTLVDTTAQTTLLRVEWPDGTLLDLGPASRAMLQPPAGVGGGAAFYLLQGWAKFSRGSTPHGWSSPQLQGSPAKGVLVLAVAPGQTRAFAETGAQPLLERPAGRARPLAAGELLSLTAGAQAELSRRVPSDWLTQLPRAFRDTLPSRLAAVTAVMATRGGEPAAEAAPAWRYEQLQHWLSAEPALRHDFPKRFAPRLAEPEFKAAVAAHLRQHPEWAPAIEPPKRPPNGEAR